MSNIKSSSIIKPSEFPRINLVGVGAIGSKVGDILTRLGIYDIHGYDFDIVEEKNCGNQAYSKRHIGMKKVEALKDLTLENSGVPITPHTSDPEDKKYSGIVFLLTDSMKTRKAFYEANKFNIKCKMIIDVRMGLYSGHIYAFDPCNPIHTDNYEASLYDDSEAFEGPVSLCGVQQDLYPTSSLLASIASQKVLDWYMINVDNDPEVPYIVNETLIAMKGKVQLIENTWK